LLVDSPLQVWVELAGKFCPRGQIYPDFGPENPESRFFSTRQFFAWQRETITIMITMAFIWFYVYDILLMKPMVKPPEIAGEPEVYPAELLQRLPQVPQAVCSNQCAPLEVMVKQ